MADVDVKPAGDNAKPDRESRGGNRNDRGRGRNNNSGGRGRGGRGRGGNSRGGHRNNDSKRDDRNGKNTKSDDPDDIRAQVEFYFSDSNLNKDRFLFEKTGGPENKPIDIETIASFSLMRRFKPFEAVVAALKESEILAVNDKEQVYRKEPLVTLSNDFEENKRLLAERALPMTLYVKGFRAERDYRDSQRKVQDFFRPYGIVEVRLRRHGDDQRAFKGSAFVEFPDVAAADKFRGQKHRFEGRDLEVLPKREYIDREVAAVLEHFDAAAFEEAQREAALADARKRLEKEYMEPQAPSAADAKKDEQEETDAHAKLVAKQTNEAKAKYVTQQAKEREARAANRNSGKTGANKSEVGQKKRSRDEEQDGEEPESKRQRDGDGEEATNGGEGKSEAAEGTEEKVVEGENGAVEAAAAKEPETEATTTEAS